MDGLGDRRTDMYELICRSIENRTTSAEEARLRAWREAAPENEAMYEDLARLGAMAGEVIRASSTAPPAAAEILARHGVVAAKPRLSRGIVAWGSGAALATAAAIA